MITSQEALTYLDYQMRSGWPNIGNMESGLFATYKSNILRCDSYDNALLANALIMLQPSTPHPFVLMILNFFYGSYMYIKNGNNPNSILIEAAFLQRNANPEPCDDFSCFAQDVGNNALILIAVIKFCIVFPDHPQTPNFLQMILFLLNSINKLQACNGSTPGWRGRIDQFYISTEHMIDLYGVGKLLLLLPTKLNFFNEVLPDFNNISVSQFAQTLYTTARIFIKEAGVEQPFPRFLIGTKSDCTWNYDDPQPVDTTTWNMLAGLYESIEFLQPAMDQVCSKFGVDVNHYPGIRFTLNSNCSQYENTGSFLCSVALYEQVYKKPYKCPLVDTMYSFLKSIYQNNEPFQASYGGDCSTGLTWSYYAKPHLASTVYCTLALLKDANFNIYQLGNSGSVPKPGQSVKPKQQGYSSTAIIILSIFLVLSVILGIVVSIYAFA